MMPALTAELRHPDRTAWIRLTLTGPRTGGSGSRRGFTGRFNPRAIRFSSITAASAASSALRTIAAARSACLSARMSLYALVM